MSPPRKVRRSGGTGTPAPPKQAPLTESQNNDISMEEVMDSQPSTSQAVHHLTSPQPSTSAMAFTPKQPSPAQAVPTVEASTTAAPTSAIADENADENDDLNPMSQFEDEEGGFTVGDIYIPPPIKPYCSSESHGSRLMITKIMNTNFKSYAQDVALGPFCHVS